jgi:DNA modification methylase
MMAATAWRNRIVGHGDEAPDQLLANPKNWRIHPKAQQDALSGVLDEVGWVQEVIVNKITGHVVDGHLRVSLAISRQEPKIPVKYVELTPEEEALVLATLDPLAGMAATAKDALESLLADVQPGSDAVTALLEDVARGAGLNGAQEGLTDPDAVPKAEAVSKRGDVWMCGDHRVMCGDSTDAGDVARLMAGEKARLMVTDPPYGVGYEGAGGGNPKWGNRNRPDIPIANDDLGDDQVTFWTVAFTAWPLKGDAYVFAPPGPLGARLLGALESAGIPPRQWLVWAKHHFSIGRSHYHYQHEPIAYGWKGSTSWAGSRSESSIWEADKPAASNDHPTMKPVALCERAITNSSKTNDLVIDPFLGSGTTMIAAERLGRRCYGMEIEGRYVDVAVRRWEEFTGRKAVLEHATS